MRPQLGGEVTQALRLVEVVRHEGHVLVTGARESRDGFHQLIVRAAGHVNQNDQGLLGTQGLATSRGVSSSATNCVSRGACAPGVVAAVVVGTAAVVVVAGSSLQPANVSIATAPASSTRERSTTRTAYARRACVS